MIINAKINLNAINVDDWLTAHHIELGDESGSLLAKIVRDSVAKNMQGIISEAMNGEDNSIDFDVYYNPEADPLDIAVRIFQFSGDKDTFVINLDGLLNDQIEECAEYGSYAKSLRTINDALKKLSARIDDATAGKPDDNGD